MTANHQSRDDLREIGGLIVRKEVVVDPVGEALGLVVRGILAPTHGMSATNVEKKDTGLDIAVPSCQPKCSANFSISGGRLGR